MNNSPGLSAQLGMCWVEMLNTVAGAFNAAAGWIFSSAISLEAVIVMNKQVAGSFMIMKKYRRQWLEWSPELPLLPKSLWNPSPCQNVVRKLWGKDFPYLLSKKTIDLYRTKYLPGLGEKKNILLLYQEPRLEPRLAIKQLALLYA